MASTASTASSTILDAAQNMSVTVPKRPNGLKVMRPRVAKEESKEESKERELCGICADAYTPVLRRKITCKFCSKDACTKCIEQYLLSRSEDAHCIHCRVNYSDSVLRLICTKTYLQQTYFRHRQEILVNRERANLPALQTAAQQERRLRDSYEEERKIRAEIEELKLQKHEWIVQHSRLYLLIHNRTEKGEDVSVEQEQLIHIIKQQSDLKRRINEKKKELNLARHNQWRIRNGGNGGNGDNDENGDEKKDGGDEKKEEKRKFIRRCMKPNCQGFLSTAWKCGICENYSCAKCFTVKGSDHDTPHTCKKEDLETADLIRADSKPCPNCGEFINKSSGCSQIWCVTCRTPWDWNTGKIVTHGVIHNPHYYEWLKRNGGEMPRNPADIPCGGYPAHWELRNIGRNISRRCSQYFFEFHRICMELQDHTERQYRSHIDQNVLQDTHVRFLLGDFDEKDWGRRLAMAEKRRKRDAEIQEVFAAFRMVAVELINRVQHYRDETYDAFTLLPSKKADAYLEEWNKEVQALIGMVNEGLKTISSSYSCQVPIIIYNDISSSAGHSTRTIYYSVRNYKFSSVTRKKKEDAVKADVQSEEEKGEHEEDEEHEDEEDEEDNEDQTEDTAILRVVLERSLVEQ